MTLKLHDVTGKLVIDYRAREWCGLSYPGHKKGCPNFNNPKRCECPPQAPLIENWLDLEMPHWFIVISFDLGGHVQKMKDRHPHWTERQCRNVLYWQGKVRKQLKTSCEGFCVKRPETVYTLLPEAMGVHVIRTAKKLGIPIKTRPTDTVFKIALLGYPRIDRPMMQRVIG